MCMDETDRHSTRNTATEHGNQMPLKEKGKYVQEHFKYVADQRMKSFNYYAILTAAAFTGTVAAYDKCPWYVLAAIGMAHCAMATIFFCIDYRNGLLVMNARRACRQFETMAFGDSPDLRVISNDEIDSNGSTSVRSSHGGQRHPFRKLVASLLPGSWKSFTGAFDMAFVLQLLCGTALIVIAVTIKRT